jgi:hypothetical protein
MATKSKSDNTINSRIAHYQSKGYGRKAAIGKAYGEKKTSKSLPKKEKGGWSYAGSQKKKPKRSSAVSKEQLATEKGYNTGKVSGGVSFGNSGGNTGVKSGAVAQGGQFLGKMTDQIDSKNGRSDTGQALSGGLKGAGTGASVGTMIAPGVGTAIGAGVGAVAGALTSPTPSEKFNWSKQDIAAAKQHRRKAKANNNAPGAGVDEHSADFFEKGGDLEQYMIPKAKEGGNVKNLSDNVRKYKGQTHEEGGIQVDIDQDSEADIEVETGEVQFDGKIFSDAIKAPGKKNKTIADQATKIGKDIDKYEKLAEDHPMDNERQNTADLMTKRLNQDLIKLFTYQQLKKRKNQTQNG